MIIIGNVRKLHSFLPWERFIDHCLKNGLVRTGNLNEDGIIERIHTLHISNPTEEDSSTETESEEDSSSEDEEKTDAAEKVIETINWADEVE
jgi:hypothetical protein